MDHEATTGYTPRERRIEAAAHRLLARAQARGTPGWLVECAVFVAKQAWACVFGFLLLAVIVAARLWYPEDALLARNDALTLAAVLLQALMLLTRLETLGELRVVLLFHVAGTVMEVFKTAVGSWQYDPDGVLRLGVFRCSRGSCTPPSARTWCACTGSSPCASTATRGGG